MGKKYVIDEATLTAIANKMRDITLSNNKICPEDMPKEIDRVNENAYGIGHDEGAFHKCEDMLGGAW